MINELMLTAALLSNNVTYLYTPKGSVITAYTNTEISSSQISEYNTLSDLFFSNDVRFSNASYKYSSHSYTFYSQRVDLNHYWSPNPSLYINDDMTELLGENYGK